jgi:hypothetical protein
MFRTFRTIPLFALMLAIAGCATTPPMRPPAFDLTGVWQGETRVTPCAAMYTVLGRCNAVNRITFAIRQEGSVLRGDYKCGIGNAVCRDANKTTEGTIVDGWLSGSTMALRVLLPGDLSSCIYNGEVSSTQARGGYRCYQGGGLNEVGIWQVSRQAELPMPADQPAAGR